LVQLRVEGIHCYCTAWLIGVQTPNTLEAMLQLTCTTVHLLIVNYVFTVLKTACSCHGALMYPGFKGHHLGVCALWQCLSNVHTQWYKCICMKLRKDFSAFTVHHCQMYPLRMLRQQVMLSSSSARFIVHHCTWNTIQNETILVWNCEI